MIFITNYQKIALVNQFLSMENSSKIVEKFRLFFNKLSLWVKMFVFVVVS